ncbi:LAQU0S04e09692g1_1 [Lachancea quebecensis]|uniref:Sulfhydryl oxidase n=1 Tax=Lachancea quebecensis TaxID=1654605 RepID=A0A0P1KR28_9SACH|nr:LAQU0S04e09692g1_1 [Lachancea quebecensis]
MIHRQRLVSILAAISLLSLWFFFSSNKLSYSTPNDPVDDLDKGANTEVTKLQGQNKQAEPKFQSIMPSMPDQKAKQELGRASWKYFHTVLSRFPDEPTQEERGKLAQFLQLYAELYPCGECSYHFVQMLKKWPPQTSSRTAAALWGCHMHNRVNAYLEKDEYDCSKILEDYDCGCGGEDGKINDKLKMNKVSLQKEGKQGG